MTEKNKIIDELYEIFLQYYGCIDPAHHAIYYGEMRSLLESAYEAGKHESTISEG